MQNDKVESPFEIPILSLTGVQKGTEIDGSMADGATASVHFDLPLVSHCLPVGASRPRHSSLLTDSC